MKENNLVNKLEAVEHCQYFEAVEYCAYCDSENVYPMWDVSINGYVATCKYCGEQIMLCDECFHSEDNPNRNCDWCATKCGGKCFRGTTNNRNEVD